MTLSVIVTSYAAPDGLLACLASLTAQAAAAEIVVADCSPIDPTERVRAAFPRVRVLHFADRLTVPELRWAALSETHGDVIAATEARCVPAANWCAALKRAHEAAPEVPAIGGPVALKPGASAFDWGLCFAEFGAFLAPLPDADARELSGANLSFKRADLESARDLIDQGAWETLLHDRWVRTGRTLRIRSDATVVFHNGMRPADALAMRFYYGRGYAAARFARSDGRRRALYAAGSLILPGLLISRTVAAASRRRLMGALVRSLPWVVAFHSLWAAGEFVGYLFGPSSEPHIF